MINKYDEMIESVFHNKYKDGLKKVEFSRDELINSVNGQKPKNIGDIIYSYRFRKELPTSISAKAPLGNNWIIVGTGLGKYEFRLASPAKLQPCENLKPIEILDATPAILKKYLISNDEQALLTKVRYNRLVDIFLGLTCYSIQNHLRTTVDGIGQIEVDEIYIGVNSKGERFLIPCQAKSKDDSFGIVQAIQDIALAKQIANKIDQSLGCRSLVLKFKSLTEIVMAEVSVEENEGVYQFSFVAQQLYSLIENS